MSIQQTQHRGGAAQLWQASHTRNITTMMMTTTTVGRGKPSIVKSLSVQSNIFRASNILPLLLMLLPFPQDHIAAVDGDEAAVGHQGSDAAQS